TEERGPAAGFGGRSTRRSSGVVVMRQGLIPPAAGQARTDPGSDRAAARLGTAARARFGGDRLFFGVVLSIGVAVLVIAAAMFLVLAEGAWPALLEYGPAFLW